jgi:hypothetical protein
MHPATFAQPYTKKGAFYNSVKASILKHYPVLKSFKECLGSTSSRKHDVQQAAAARKRQFGDTVTSDSIADERATAQRRLHTAATAHESYEASA